MDFSCNLSEVMDCNRKFSPCSADQIRRNNSRKFGFNQKSRAAESPIESGCTFFV
uniref:Uncharacterized protein n=1 Tax=Arundo donax TaxID=35708 RepID=A0A0A9EK60_ARUDO